MTYVLSDVNFAGITDAEQKEMLINYSNILKTFTSRFSITVANEYVDEKDFNEKILYALKGDELDTLRSSYNAVIKDKVSDAKQGLYQTIYLTLTISANSLSEARQTFLSKEGAIKTAFIGLGSNGMQGSILRALSIDERMQLLFNFTHSGIKTDYKFDFNKELNSFHDWENIIAPVSITLANEDLRLNDKYGRVLFIDDYPNSLESDVISKLSDINCTSYISVNNELLEVSELKQELARKYMSVGMKIENEKKRNRNNNDFLAETSKVLQSQKQKLDLLTKEIDELDDHYFNTTILIAFLANSKEELEEITEKIKEAASMKSFKVKPCFGKQAQGLVSAFPFGVQEFKKVVNLSSSCLAMFVPFKTQELNDHGGTYYGVNQLSCNAIFANKKILKNHNGMILGQSGSGKSMFAKSEIISVFINNPDDQVIIIDPQSEYKAQAAVVDGTVISFDSSKEFYLNPLDVDFKDADYTKLREIISEKSDFILSLLACCLKRELNQVEQGVLDSVIDRVYSDNYSLRKRLNGETKESLEYQVPEYMLSAKSSKTFDTDLSNEEQIRAYSPTLQDIYQGLLDEASKEAAFLAAGMEIFVNGSLNLFNHRTNIDLNNRFIVFDISNMKDNIRITAILIMMETVRSKIKENSKQGVWTHLYIDEFHELLSIETVADFILRMWKEIRKMHGILTGITQNMTDLLDNDSGKLTAILSNTEYFALLSQSTIDKEILMKFLPQISPAMFGFVDNAAPGTGLLKMGTVTVPFDMRMSKSSEIYKLINTDGGAYGV